MRRRKGVIRVLEALAAVALLLATFAISQYLIVPPNPKIVRLKTDLELMGYNALASVARDGGFDQLLSEPYPFWCSKLKLILNNILPYGVVFNLTVYKGNATSMQLDPLNESISNTNPEVFLKAGEVAQTTYIYTMRNFTTYIFELKLARLGSV